MDASTRRTVGLTREEIAKREVGHTAVSPAVARTLVGAFLVFVCALPLFELSRIAQGDDVAREPWRHLAQIPSAVHSAVEGGGPWTALVSANRSVLNGLHEFETALEDASRVGRLLRPRAQLLLSGPLGAGNEQAYLGQDDWLFYRTDVDYVVGRGFLDPEVMARRVSAADEWTDPPQPDPRQAILHFKAQLDARGIELIVLPVPVKPTVHPERLAAANAPATRPVENPDYDRFIEDLRQAEVTVFDTTAILRQAAQGGAATQYLATDTHWRPEAMEMAAQQLARMIRERVSLGPVEDPGYRIEPTDVANRGDTFTMLDLPEEQDLFSPEQITLRRVVNTDGSPWRPDRDASVLLLGDSFANIYSLESMGWGSSAGLAEHLSLALGRPIDRIVQNADGAYATREALQRSGPERLAGKKVVIWQFATRELAFGDWRVY